MNVFSANNLRLMRQFYTEYSSDEILEQVVQELATKASDAKSFSKPSNLEHCIQDLLSPVPRGPILSFSRR